VRTSPKKQTKNKQHKHDPTRTNDEIEKQQNGKTNADAKKKQSEREGSK